MTTPFICLRWILAKLTGQGAGTVTTNLTAQTYPWHLTVNPQLFKFVSSRQIGASLVSVAVFTHNIATLAIAGHNPRPGTSSLQSIRMGHGEIPDSKCVVAGRRRYGALENTPRNLKRIGSVFCHDGGDTMSFLQPDAVILQ